jgi:hypothetical protein
VDVALPSCACAAATGWCQRFSSRSGRNRRSKVSTLWPARPGQCRRSGVTPRCAATITADSSWRARCEDFPSGCALARDRLRGWGGRTRTQKRRRKFLFERSHRFAGIQPNSGFGDYSRLSCGVGDMQLGRSEQTPALSATQHPCRHASERRSQR